MPFSAIARIQLAQLREKTFGNGAVGVQKDQGEALVIAEVRQCPPQVADVFEFELRNDLADCSRLGESRTHRAGQSPRLLQAMPRDASSAISHEVSEPRIPWDGH